jgi:hypothetical protein
MDLFWNTLSADVVEAHCYNEHPELFKLKPWASAQWTGNGVGIHNYPTNFFDLVRSGKIRVHVADITNLDSNIIHLTNGEQINTDVLICATGWKKQSSLKFVNFDCGLPFLEEEKIRMRKDADKQVRNLFPGLKAQPVMRYDQKDGEPLRNYRFIVPSAAVFKRNIAFAGMVSTVCTAIFSSVQGLWILAFFDGKLTRTPRDSAEVVDEIMLHTQFEKWRYLSGYGAYLPNFAFDSLPYVVLLVNDLGLKNHREASHLQELVELYKPWDYLQRAVGGVAGSSEVITLTPGGTVFWWKDWQARLQRDDCVSKSRTE